MAVEEHGSHSVDVLEYFDDVIKKVSNKWDDLARKLGCDRNEVIGIRTSEPDNDHRCREVLDRWRNREGREATLQVLKQALIDIGERRTAESLEGVRRYFYFIKEEVSSDWKNLAYHLGVSPADVNNIAGRNRDDKSCCMDLLDEWFKRNGEVATIEVLMKALSKAKLQSTVDKLKKMYPETAAQRHPVGENQAQTESIQAPDGLKAWEITNDTVKLGWTKASSNQTDGYRLEQSIAFEHRWASAQGDRKMLPATITEFTVVDLSPYHEYHFCVRSAMDRMGNLVLSDRSVPLYVVTRKQYQPYRPRKIKLADRTHTSLSLTWKEPSPAADVKPACCEYVVEMCLHDENRNLNIWTEYCRTTQCQCSIDIQGNGDYRFRVSANNTEKDVTSLPEEMGDPDLPICIKTRSGRLLQFLRTYWPFSATTQPTNQETGSIVFNISCHDLEGLRELWMNYKLGKVKTFFENLFARQARLAFVETDTELEIKIDKEDFYTCRRHLMLTRPTNKGFRLVRLGEGHFRGSQLGLSEDYPVYCKPISHKQTCSQLDFLDPATHTEQLGLDRTISDDKLLALPPLGRQVHCSSLPGLDLAVVKENQSRKYRTDDISKLRAAVRTGWEKSQRLEVQLRVVKTQLETGRQEIKALKKVVTNLTEEKEKAQKIVLEQNIRIQQLQETNKNGEDKIEGMQTARQQTEAMVLNLSKEVTRLTDEKEKAQKILQEQETEIQQLQENNKSMAATIEELMDAKHEAKGESGRKGDTETETYTGETDPGKETDSGEKEESRKKKQSGKRRHSGSKDGSEVSVRAKKDDQTDLDIDSPFASQLSLKIVPHDEESFKARKHFKAESDAAGPSGIGEIHQEPRPSHSAVTTMASASTDSPPVTCEISPRARLYFKIDQNLSEDEVKSLRAMLVTDDHIARGRMENATPHEIFNMLHDWDKMGHGNLGLLIDLLKALEKAKLAEEAEDLERHEMTTMASAPTDSPPVTCEISPRARLYLKINQNLSEDEVKNLRAMLLTDDHIGRGRMGNATPHEIFNMLHDCCKMGHGNLGLLIDLLKALGKAQLAKEAEDLERQESISGIHSKLGFKVEELTTKGGGKTTQGSSIPLMLPNDLKYNVFTGVVEKVQGVRREILQVVPEALELLEGIEEPVSVLAICGPCRSGKSYIISRLLGTSDAFELGHRMDPQTFGIWMGTKVLRGKDFTIVLLDTEGIDAERAAAGQDAGILVMTILLSSKLIYNSLNVPYKGDLEKMQCFIKLARGITVKKGEKTQMSAFREFFPDFLWLLRDVSLVITDEDGEDMDPSEYLKTRVLGRKGEDDFDESTSDQVARAILTFFPSVECATLERPSEKKEVMNNIAQHTDSLHPEFNKGVENLTERLLLEARPKRGYHKCSTVSGEVLSVMVKQYADAVNDPKSIPALHNTWHNTVQLMRGRAIEDMVMEYNIQMQSQITICSNNEPLEEDPEIDMHLQPVTRGQGEHSTRDLPSRPTLMDLHNELLNAVTNKLLRKVEHFGISSGDQSSENKIVVDEMQKRLVQRKKHSCDYEAADGITRKQEGFVVTGGELFQYIQQNRERSNLFCKDLFERLLDPIRKHVESPPPDYDFKKLMEELTDALQQYEEQARGPEKWVVLHEMIESIETLKAEIEKINGYQTEIMQEQQKVHEAKAQAKERMREIQQLRKQAQDMQRTQQETLEKMERQNREQIEKIKRERETGNAVELQKFQDLKNAKMERYAEVAKEYLEKESSKTSQMITKMEQEQANMQRVLEELKKPPPSPPTSTNFHQTVASIFSRLDGTDVRLLMRVWSARTVKGETWVPADLMKDMMKTEYITTGDLGVLQLEKDMMAAGISFPAVVRDIPGVPDELKYTRTTEAVVGPMGGELEIPGFVKLVVPPDILQQDTVITISTVDIAAILRDPESLNWISGYPWSLGEDACPRELLDRVLFSPAFDVNLHGAQLNGPVEVQTWQPQASEGMECLLLKHHDEEGWTDITTSTRHHIDSGKLSMLLQNFSLITILWAPVGMVKAVGKRMLAAFSSSTVDHCLFAAYTYPGVDEMEFHLVCRDRCVETDDYLQGFKLRGSNDATSPLYNGDAIKADVSLCGCQETTEVKLRATLCKQSGQTIPMVLRRPIRYPAIGKVDVMRFEQLHSVWQSVCKLTFREEDDTCTGAESQQRDDEAGSSWVGRDTRLTVAWCIPIVVELKPPWRKLGRNLGLSEGDTERISQRHQDDTGRCCLAVLEEWLHLSGTNATVEGLKSALNTAGQREIVEKLNTMEQSMRGELLELQTQVTDIVHANFPNLNFVPDKNKEADERRIELNRRTLREEVFSHSLNFSLDSVILDRIQERKKSVCRINFPGGSGTGFLLSKGKVLTCYHVYRMMNRALWSVHEASQYTATFFVSVEREYKVPFETPAALLKCYSEDLDYAILQLAVDNEMERNLASLPLLGHFISESEDSRKMVVLVGHPSGGSKVFDFGFIAGVVQRYIIHVRFPNLIQEDQRKPLYDTSVMFHGASGSPGFDTYGNLVLMHTSGFPDARSKSLIERGVRLSAIRDHARHNLALDIFNEIFPVSLG